MAFRCARDSCRPAFLIWTSASALTFASNENAQQMFKDCEKAGLQTMYTPPRLNLRILICWVAGVLHLHLGLT